MNSFQCSERSGFMEVELIDDKNLISVKIIKTGCSFKLRNKLIIKLTQTLKNYFAVFAQSAVNQHSAFAGIQDGGREKIEMGFVTLRRRQNLLGRIGIQI